MSTTRGTQPVYRQILKNRTPETVRFEDTLEFFNLVLELKLSREEKAELTAFLRHL